MSIYSDIENNVASVYSNDGPLAGLVNTFAVMQVRPDQQDRLSSEQIAPVKLPAICVDADRNAAQVLTASLGSVDYLIPVEVTTIVQNTKANLAKDALDAIVDDVERVSNANCNSTNDWGGGGFVTLDGAITTVRVYETEAGYIAYAKTNFTVLKNVNL